MVLLTIEKEEGRRCNSCCRNRIKMYSIHVGKCENNTCSVVLCEDCAKHLKGLLNSEVK